MKHKSANRAESVGLRIIDRLQEFTETLEGDQAIDERFTCRTIALDLSPAKYSPDLVRQTRRLLNLSQPLFAQFLGTSTNTVRAWEQGVNRPSAMARRFMDEIRNDPERFRARLQRLAVQKKSAAKR